jgi:hypothetical protein
MSFLAACLQIYRDPDLELPEPSVIRPSATAITFSLALAPRSAADTTAPALHGRFDRIDLHRLVDLLALDAFVQIHVGDAELVIIL